MTRQLPTVHSAERTQPAELGSNHERGPLIGVGALAERLGVDVRFVRRLVDERRIPFYKVGRHVRFDPGDVDQWVADRRVTASSTL